MCFADTLPCQDRNEQDEDKESDDDVRDNDLWIIGTSIVKDLRGRRMYKRSLFSIILSVITRYTCEFLSLFFSKLSQKSMIVVL
jgi:hypothetical protein